MKDLQERLKTVKELLTHAKFIRSKAGAAAAGEANAIESYLEARAAQLEAEIKTLKQQQAKQAQQPELVHA